jgi:ribosome biogenesis GTPase A
MEQIGEIRGCFKKGAEVDLLKTSQLILNDFQRGALAPITLEGPPQ